MLPTERGLLVAHLRAPGTRARGLRAGRRGRLQGRGAPGLRVAPGSREQAGHRGAPPGEAQSSRGARLTGDPKLEHRWGVICSCAQHSLNTRGGAPGEAPRQALVPFLHPHSRSFRGQGQRTPRPQAPGGKASPTSALLSFSLCWPVLATAAPHRPPSQDAPHRQAPPRGCSGGWARRPGPCRVGWGEGGLGGRGSVGPARLPAALAWPHPASSLTWHRLPGLQPCTSEQP